ncbi:Fur family transcriptional regulator [Ligilactobacillus faecis]|uniref:Fur family transcriptional regulator n=1 Tax=Ligilactobacillus faecis TaxID=762833 RepID=A0ABV4DQI0_9LACO|nr:Fur family transcriptional regulator [Ligilactobacillus faecis]WGN89207.1 Fur family transcriptional regulator [Ligilactobacillus faecis]
MRELTQIEDKLHARGFKLTPQRRATIKTLVTHKEEHLSAEEIYSLLHEAHPEVGLATVYRTLDILAEIQIVNKITFEDGIARFDLKTEDKGHFHHHLVCECCGSVNEIHEDMLLDVEQRIKRQYHFEVRDHRLTFLGTCQDCLRKKRLEQLGQSDERK